MDVPEIPSFSLHIRQERIQRHWRQQDLADEVGTTIATIKRWERGSHHPSAYFRSQLAAIFGKSAEELGFFAETPLAPDEKKTEEGTIAAENPPPSLSTYLRDLWSIPYARNPFFTGRDLILEHLHTVLTHEPTIAALTQSYALHGLGGIGKTQLATEYAYQYRSDYEGVFWIEAETLTSLTASFVALATLLSLPEKSEEDQRKIVAAVLRWLNHHERWLLIFDNVEDLSLLKPFLPSNDRGALLLTTRLQNLGTLAQTVEISSLTLQEGTDFLLMRTLRPATDPQERALAQMIVTELGALPLALEQAGAYINAIQCSLLEYLHLFQSAQHRLLAAHEPASDHPLSVARTFALAFEQVEHRNPLATALLTACAFLAPDTIPETFFSQGTTSIGSPFESLVSDPLAFAEALKVCLSYSLIQRDANAHTITIHRLVQVVLRERISEAEQQQWQMRTLHMLSAAFPDGSYQTWEQCERFLPHMLTCVTALPEQTKNLELAEVLLKTATYLTARARYEQAKPLYERALRLRVQALGPEHPAIATVLYQLADLALHQGRYEQAEALYERVLSIREQTLGPDHSEIASVLHRLAILCQNQGKYEQAEPLYKRALHIREQALGPDHLEVARVLNGLAALYRRQGKYEQAEPLYKRALSIREQALGPDHPDVAGVLNNLATLFQKQEKYEQAEALYQQALHIYEQTLGPEHPFVTEVVNGLATLQVEQGHYEQAKRLYEQALSIRERILEPQHPEIAQTLSDLAVCCQKQGQLSQALSLSDRALAIRMQSLGNSHPKTIVSQTQYAQLVQAMEGLEGQSLPR